MNNMTPIDRAVDICKSQDALAEKLGVTQGLVSQWVNGALIHQRHFPAIEKATSGEVTTGQLLEHELEKLDEKLKENGRKRRA